LLATVVPNLKTIATWQATRETGLRARGVYLWMNRGWPSRHPEGRHDTVPRRDDGRHVPLVLGDETVVLKDGLRVIGSGILGIGSRDAPRPQHVVGGGHPAEPAALWRGGTSRRS